MDTYKLINGLKNPIEAWQYLKSIWKGYYYKIIYILSNKKVKIGKNFRVTGKLIIKGPGKIFIGDNVVVGDKVTPWTYSKDAEISIGNNVFLNGTRFGCRKRIEVGDDCILADCRILDTDFHSINPNKRNDLSCINSEPVRICRNVWISMDCIILKGVTIHSNTTITPNSVVFSDIPAYSLFGGNPATLIKYLPRE